MSMIARLPLETSSNPAAEDGDLPHVLLVVDQLSKTLGGGERIVLKLATLLPSYGYRASILTFAADPETPAFKSSPCPIYLLPLTRTYSIQSLRAAFDFRRLLKQHRVQIVQTFFESSDIWAGFVTKAMSGAKLIWSRRDMGILRTDKHHLAYRLMAKAPDAVFAVSDEVRRHCIEVDKINPARVQTVHNGLDLAGWNGPRSQKSTDEILVTTVGNIRPVKGHDIFIRAAASIARKFPAASFSIAGEVLDPAYFSKLEALVRDLGLTERFHFAGGVTNLHQHLASADIFVLPSRSEGFSNAIIEAMAASLPVIATTVGGNAEAVQEGVTGLLVPPDDPEALAAAMTHLISHPDRSTSMGDAGKKRVMEEFTTQVMMNRTVAAYCKLLKPHPVR